MKKNELTTAEKIALIGVKNVLDLEDLCLYTGMSSVRIYVLCHKGQIPYYKAGDNDKWGNPSANYFKKAEIDAWLTKNEMVKGDAKAIKAGKTKRRK